MNRLTLLATLMATLVMIPACHNTHQKSTIPSLSIESAEAITTIVCDQIGFATSTEPIRSVTIEPRVNGYLGSITYNNGKLIRRGDQIFQIDPTQIYTELYAAEAALESARASEVEARNNYLRATPLVKISAISQSDYDNYTATYRAAEAEVKSAEQSLRNAQLNLSYTTINAPIDGIIASSPANEGDYVGPGTQFTTLTTITQIDTLQVKLPIPISKYLKYRANQNSSENEGLLSQITLILPDSSIYPHLGVYDYTEQTAAFGSSTVVIVANVANPNGVLKAGMFARISALIGEPRECVIIPQRAVTQLQGVNMAWVIAPDSTVSMRSVTLDGTYGQYWRVKDGISSGEMVATTGQLKLHKGDKVIPIGKKLTTTKE